MSTPEQPATPPLTRKQMREIRNTGATPIIGHRRAAREDAPVADAPAAPSRRGPVEVAAAVEAPEQSTAAPARRTAAACR